MGVAALVIILLLYLGYKLDTKESDPQSSKAFSKIEKNKKKLAQKAEAIQQNSGVYEADEAVYEADDEIFNNDDLNDFVEYKDDEDSLFSVSSADELDDADNFEEMANVIEEDLRDCPKMVERLKSDSEEPLYAGHKIICGLEIIQLESRKWVE